MTVNEMLKNAIAESPAHRQEWGQMLYNLLIWHGHSWPLLEEGAEQGPDAFRSAYDGWRNVVSGIWALLPYFDRTALLQSVIRNPHGANNPVYEADFLIDNGREAAAARLLTDRGYPDGIAEEIVEILVEYRDEARCNAEWERRAEG